MQILGGALCRVIARMTRQVRMVTRGARLRASIESGLRVVLLLLGCGESAIRFCPPLCITAAQVETCLHILDGAIAAA